MGVHLTLALPNWQPAARRDAVHGRPARLRLVRREEAVALRERRRGRAERREPRGRLPRDVGDGQRLREDVLVHVAEVLEVGGEEDVEVTLSDEERLARHGGVLVPRLYDRRVDTGDRVGEGGKVREEKTMTGEVATEGAKESEQAGGDELGGGEVGREGKISVECTERGRKLEETRYWWWVVQIATQSEERTNERVRDFRVIGTKVSVLVDGDYALIWFQCPKIVTY